MKAQIVRITIACILLMSQSAFALEYYRYTDENGNISVDASIPAEYVKNGYEVLNSMGLVVRQVAPEKTEEEKAIALQKQKEEMEFEQLKNRLNRLYRSPTDVDRAMIAAEERIRVSISAQKRRISRHQQLYDEAQAKAATAQRNSKEVPQELLDQMEEALEYIHSLELSIEEKKEDILEKRIELKRERDVMFVVYRERYYEKFEDTITGEEIDQLYYVPPEYEQRPEKKSEQ
ncbi:hypothetical protein [Marinicellulosiphila megalodicopiae]|uniref:hypothetical protein n=1 Tax=Marinicellulosiphila megalodicopiae TaxID=2724896 RepID=UPI003BB079D7